MPLEKIGTFQGMDVIRKEVNRENRNTRKCVRKKCKYCGNEHFPLLKEVKAGRGKFCSSRCAGKSKTGSNNQAYRGKADLVRKIKEEGECTNIDCNESRPEALCFHHRNPDTKVESVSRMAQEGKYSLEDVKEEIEKCSLFCANCHKVEHSKRSRTEREPVPEHSIKFEKYEETDRTYQGKKVYLGASKRRHIIKACEYCGQDFMVAVGELKRGWGMFHSRSCSSKYRTENGDLLNNLENEKGKKGIVRDKKEDGICCKEECNESRPVCLEFHHKEGNKVESITNMLTDGSTKEELLNELEKCEIICRNCHEVEHSNCIT